MVEPDGHERLARAFAPLRERQARVQQAAGEIAAQTGLGGTASTTLTKLARSGEVVKGRTRLQAPRLRELTRKPDSERGCCFHRWKQQRVARQAGAAGTGGADDDGQARHSQRLTSLGKERYPAAGRGHFRCVSAAAGALAFA
jgi:hypothetical protein